MAARWWKATGLVLVGAAMTALAMADGPPRAMPASPPLAAAASAPEDDIPFAAADAAAVSVPSSPQAWGGPRTGQEPTLSDRVVDYRIQVSLDPDKHTLKGKQQLTWRNRSDVPVRAVYLHLYLNAFRNEGSTFFSEKRNLGFDFRSDVPMKDGEWGWIDMTRVMQAGAAVSQTFVQPDNGPSTDMTVVRLDLPQAVAPGGSTTLDIDFDAQLPRVIARTGYFGSFHLIAQWFPKIGVLELPGERGATTPRWNVHEFHLHSEFYADFGSYDVTLDVPSEYRVGATGELQGTPTTANGRTRHRYVQHDVHDFAWTADKNYAEPLLSDWAGPGSPPVKIRVLYPPEFKASAAPALKATQDSLTYFSRTLGPYPYRTVTVVIPAHNATEAGGMEYPTFFTADSFEQVPALGLNALALDFVTIHEFGHGYFYGILASNEFEEPMLDEGLNEYWDQRMLREAGNRYIVAPEWLRRLGVRPHLGEFELERLGARLDDPADGTGANSWGRLSSSSYGAVYSRTATVMRDLEAQLGTPAIEKAFKDYYATWKFRHPSIADLRESLAVSTGRRDVVERVFAQQVYATRKVDDRIERFTSTEVLPLAGFQMEKGKRVDVSEAERDKRISRQREAWDKANPKARPGSGPFPWRTTVLVRRDGAAVPQTLVVTFADGSRKTVQWDDDAAWKRFVWEGPSKAVSVQLDPQKLHYLDANKLDDSRTLESDGSAARRWSADFAALFQALQTFLVSL